MSDLAKMVAELFVQCGATVRFVYSESGWWIFRRRVYRYLWIDSFGDHWRVWRADNESGAGRIATYAIDINVTTGERGRTETWTGVVLQRGRGRVREASEEEAQGIWSIVTQAIQTAWEQRIGKSKATP